jgi:hypothetical protein
MKRALGQSGHRHLWMLKAALEGKGLLIQQELAWNQPDRRSSPTTSETRSFTLTPPCTFPP